MVRLELVFSLVLPNLVWAKVAVVKVSGAWAARCTKAVAAAAAVELLLPAARLAPPEQLPLGFGLPL